LIPDTFQLPEKLDRTICTGLYLEGQVRAKVFWEMKAKTGKGCMKTKKIDLINVGSENSLIKITEVKL
jgi:hypothetical protein